MSKYSYAIWEERDNLIRFSPEKVELFCPSKPEEWVAMPHLEELRYGGGNFVWYDDITEEEAMQYKERIRKKYEENAAQNTDN